MSPSAPRRGVVAAVSSFVARRRETHTAWARVVLCIYNSLDDPRCSSVNNISTNKTKRMFTFTNKVIHKEVSHVYIKQSPPLQQMKQTQKTKITPARRIIRAIGTRHIHGVMCRRYNNKKQELVSYTVIAPCLLPPSWLLQLSARLLHRIRPYGYMTTGMSTLW